MTTTALAVTDADIASVRVLFSEYLEMLGHEYGNAVGSAQGQDDLDDFPQAYLALFIGKCAGVPRAACSLKHINAGAGDRDAELGKLYCRPSGRGHTFGRKLTEAAIAHARSLGYARLVLSTEPIMKHAISLYADMGFERIEKYACGRSGCSRFMGIEL